MTGLEVGLVVVGWEVGSLVGWGWVGLGGMTGREGVRGWDWPRGWRGLLVQAAPRPGKSFQNLSFISQNKVLRYLSKSSLSFNIINIHICLC